MKPHHAFVLSVLHPWTEPPPAPAAPPRDPGTGRFIAPQGISLGGGVGYTPLPIPPPDGYAEHNAFLIDALAPKDLGA